MTVMAGVRPFLMEALPEPPSPAARRSAAAAERAELVAEARREGLRLARAEVDAAVAAHEHAAALLERAATAVQQAAAELASRDAVTLEALEGQAVALAMALAEGLVGTELRAIEPAVLGAMQRAAQLVPERGEVVVRVHPDDAAAAGEAGVPGLSAREIRVVADPGVEPGGCVLDVGDCRIDAQLGAAAARMKAALGVGA